MRNKFSIRVERDRSFDADDTGGWMVVRYFRRRGYAGWNVVHRGDIAECQDYARDLVDDQRHAAMGR